MSQPAVNKETLRMHAGNFLQDWIRGQQEQPHCLRTKIGELYPRGIKSIPLFIQNLAGLNKIRWISIILPSPHYILRV